MKMGATISEKILARASGKEKVVPDEFLFVKPDVVVCNDFGLAEIVTELNEIGVKKVNFDPDKIVITLDHRVPANNLAYAEKHKKIRNFVKEQGIKYFYDVGRGGISHQLTAEEGHARPGILYAVDDTSAPTLGALGCFAFVFAFGHGLAEAFALGEFLCAVPKSLKFHVSGRFDEGVMSRDLIQQVLGDLGPGGAADMVMEFVGPAIEEMSIDGRMALCNQTQNTGAMTGIIPPDEKTIEYVEKRAKGPFYVLKSDSDAEYEGTFDYDVTKLEPMVAAPHDPGNTKAVSDVEGVKIDQAYIGSCAGGRLEDLRIAAKILRNKKVHPETRLIIVPSSREVYMNALNEGLIKTFIQADAVVCNPTCGACAGGHMGVLAPEEVCISSTTINYQGRMGSEKAEIYLASPATIAASAVKGKIADPRKFL